MSSIYTVPLPDFPLPAASISTILDFSNGYAKFIPRHYANGLFEQFSKYKLGVYSVTRKEDRIDRAIVARFECAHSGCEKKFQLTCKRSIIVEGQDILWTVRSNEGECDHSGETPRSRNISGSVREKMKERLKLITPRCLYEELIDADNETKVAAGSTIVPSKNTIRIVRHETLKENDLSKDPAVDVMKHAEDEEFKFIELSVVPFRCGLVSERQIQVVLDYSKCNPYSLRRAYFDATGSILSKLKPENSELMIYFLIFAMKTADINEHHLRFNVAEFISESQKSTTIEMFLRHVVSFSKTLLFHEIVLDWSWAEMNAVVNAFNNMTVKEYLQLTFDIMTTGDVSKLDGLLVMKECSSHLTKTMKEDIKKHFADFNSQAKICNLLGNIFDSRSMEEATVRIKSLIIVLSSPCQSNDVTAALDVTEELFLQCLLTTI